jgi:hypothetical protein
MDGIWFDALEVRETFEFIESMTLRRVRAVQAARISAEVTGEPARVETRRRFPVVRKSYFSLAKRRNVLDH